MTQCNVKAKNFKTKWLKFAIHFATLCIFFLSFIGERGKLTPCKAKQPLRGMELQEKHEEKDFKKHIRKLFRKNLKILGVYDFFHRSKQNILHAENSRVYSLHKERNCWRRHHSISFHLLSWYFFFLRLYPQCNMLFSHFWTLPTLGFILQLGPPTLLNVA